MEFNAFSSATLSIEFPTRQYEDVDVSDSYNYVNDNLVGEERTTEMNANIAYVVTGQIETKTNVAYVATNDWITTKKIRMLLMRQ